MIRGVQGIIREAMFKFKNANGPKERIFTVLDIGTEFVKSAVCEVEGKEVKVLGIGRRRQNKDEMENGVIVDIAGVIQNCNFAIKRSGKKWLDVLQEN